MRRLLAVFLLFVNLGAQAQRESPRQLYPGLFEAVQLGRVFPDGKTFVDAVPKAAPAVIRQAYEQQKTQPGFDLGRFTLRYFAPPGEVTNLYQSNIAAGIRHHIDTLWTVLERRADTATTQATSLLPLPQSYIVPGGRFREVYYWDSYFTMLGLQESHRFKLIRHILNNFAHLIDTNGFIPNGNRTYYLTRSQPPFFASMVELLAQAEGDTVLLRYQKSLLKEYAYWMAGADTLRPGHAYGLAVRLPDGTVLNRYWDASDQPREESYAEDVTSAKTSPQPSGVFYRNIRAAAASGWDFSSRWFGPAGHLGSIQTTNLLPVDLNCLLYHLENTIARSYQVQGNSRKAADFKAKAARRKKAILAYCWDKDLGWFVDYNWQLGRRTSVRTLASAFPLAFGLATRSQAKQVAAGLQKDFLKPGGLVTTLNASGEQWDAPNAWAPLEWMAISGLERYKQHTLARAIAERWAALNINVFKQTGKLLEKYNVVETQFKAGGGEYPLQDGFGWTNGVLLKIMNQYKIEEGM
ncbi:alpha,alpha-trehalase TreF [Hymenobacter cavernae]|uniref:Periplasmic trehalase n=1 Tax=Hymenobacter cavernae TaxID=2044852 RepID=A0ABQ1ULS2_9BACT|nr:alpha,alpha-trehalase TreF [Hymenobacter cavernae]GGF19663.1 periplasmic trehalase [Hymenobacter cavernae]